MPLPLRILVGAIAALTTLFTVIFYYGVSPL